MPNECTYPNLALLKIVDSGSNFEGEEYSQELQNVNTCGSGSYFVGATRSISYLSSSFGSRENNDILWHWQNPEFSDLEKYSTKNPPLFGFVDGANFIPSAQGGKSRPEAVDQKCLTTYARYNLLKDDVLTTTPDQSALGRYTKSVKDYYHDILSEDINELTAEVVKWREYSWWPYIMSPLSISFWIGGCGEPCYVCSYKGHFCIGNGELALNLVIYALDQYWLTDKADKGNLWPSNRLLVDYYGTIVRGPEPTIGWRPYLFSKNASCSYCGCIIFCILAACIDPWFIRYSAVSSVATFNAADGIPQRLPGKFIEYLESIQDQLKSDSPETKAIFWGHFSQERLFIDGQTDYYTAQIFNPGGLDSLPSGYLLGSQLDPNSPGSEIIGQDYIYAGNNQKFTYATLTDSSGFHADPAESGALKDSIFFGYRTKGAADDGGYFIRNVAVKYYDHNVRKDIFKYNWLYVDIPKMLRAEVTPAVTSFDSLDIPELYFEDSSDFLTIMRKNVYFKTILKSGDIVLNGLGGRRLYYEEWLDSFSNISAADTYYPFLWIDRIETKVVKSPYNLYFKSGSPEFKECLLGEMLTGLQPGRYYFPNPYACAASPKMAPYNGNLHGGIIGKDYWVYDYDNHKKYFSTNLPMQFLGIVGENLTSGEKDYKKILKTAKEILGDPESGSFAITSQNSGIFYTSGPIEEFPTLSAKQINQTEIIEWNNPDLPWYSEGKFDRKKMLEDQKALFEIDLRNYDKKWRDAF